jgi:hypothetical protein
MVVFQIRLPKSQDPDAFTAFMRGTYFPAVHKGPTRLGQVESLALAQGRNEHAGDDFARRFLLSVGWSGVPLEDLPRLDSDEAKAKFAAFKPQVKRLGEFAETASWPKAA